MIAARLLLALVLFASPLDAKAQQAGKVYRVGVLSADVPPPGLLDHFQDGLRELGYAEGKNVVIEPRNAGGNSERLPALAHELVRLRVDVILTVNTGAAHAAKKATASIPIVMTRIADPVKSGLVPSLSHPGGNLTGLSFMPDDVAAKQLQLLKEVVPRISRVAHLWYADNPGASVVLKTIEAASSRLDLQLLRLPVRGPSDLPGAFQGSQPRSR